MQLLETKRLQLKFNPKLVHVHVCQESNVHPDIIEPRREKTGRRGFRPGPTQTGLYKLRKELEA